MNHATPAGASNPAPLAELTSDVYDPAGPEPGPDVLVLYDGRGVDITGGYLHRAAESGWFWSDNPDDYGLRAPNGFAWRVPDGFQTRAQGPLTVVRRAAASSTADKRPLPPLGDRLKALAVRAQEQLHADVEKGLKQLGEVGWATQTRYELGELVERARNLLRTGVGNDVERDAVRDQADMLEIVAALLPAWVDRGVHPVTENNIELAATRLLHLIDELDG